MQKETIIFIPGLSGSNLLFRITTKMWELAHFKNEVFEPHWKSDETYNSKIERLLELVKTLYTEGGAVSIIGTSAGGSLALHAFIQAPEYIHAVVNICGRLRAGDDVVPSLQQASKHSSSFRESVISFEKVEPQLTLEQRKRVLTVRPVWDEIVPPFTVTLEGAENKEIYSVEHMLSIGVALTVYALPIMRFLRRVYPEQD